MYRYHRVGKLKCLRTIVIYKRLDLVYNGNPRVDMMLTFSSLAVPQVVVRQLVGCRTTTYGTTKGDKVWIMTNVSFQWFSADEIRRNCHWECLLYRLDISRDNITRYFTQCNKSEGKTSARLRTHERHTYLALTGELWLSLVICWEKSDREISGTHCVNRKSTPKSISYTRVACMLPLCIILIPPLVGPARLTSSDLYTWLDCHMFIYRCKNDTGVTIYVMRVSLLA